VLVVIVGLVSVSVVVSIEEDEEDARGSIVNVTLIWAMFPAVSFP
jgi:hypothetical protein